MFWALDDPDESDTAGGGGAGDVGIEDGRNKGEDVGDADPAGEEEQCAVRVEGRRGAIWALKKGRESERGVKGTFTVESLGEAFAAADYKGDGGGLIGVKGGLEVDKSFFGVGRGGGGGVAGGEAGVGGWRRCPGTGERMSGPEADRWNGDEGVLAWAESPRAGEANGDAKGVAG